MKTIKQFVLILFFVAGLASLSSCKDDEPEYPDTHEWVDLGLPSGTLWATCNVGASAPEEYGDYFAWGETEPKETYTWETYKWCKGNEESLTKYCTDNSLGYKGFVDNKTELDPKDDAAYVNWGPKWRMPTKDQLEELKTKCTWTLTTRNGVNGMLVNGPNGNTIFLPAAGGHWFIWFDAVGSDGTYWSRTLSTDNAIDTYYLSFSRAVYYGCDYRVFGKSVRAVRVPQN